MSFLKDYQAMGKETVRDVKRNFKPLLWICTFLIASIFIIALAYGTAHWITSFDIFHNTNSATSAAESVRPTEPPDPTIVAAQKQATATAIALGQAQNLDQATAQALIYQATTSVIQAQSQATASALETQKNQADAAANRAQADAPFWDGIVKLIIFLLVLVASVAAIIFGALTWTKHKHQRQIETIEAQARANTLSPDLNGNYAVRIDPSTGQLLQPTIGNALPANVPTNLHFAPTTTFSPTTTNTKTYSPQRNPHLTLSNTRTESPVPVTLAQPNAAENEVAQPEQELPTGIIDLATLLVNWTPDLSNILLAIGIAGKFITVSARDLCHVGIAGSTRRGKSTIIRLICAQLLKCGVIMYLADPHYTDFDVENGEDWRPIAAKLQERPRYKYNEIGDLFRWLAFDELERRLNCRRNQKPVGSPLFVVIDELPAIANEVEGAFDMVGKILREGGKVGMFAITSAQDMLVKTIGGSGAIRENFLTGYYVGGDDTTGRMLLDVKGRVDDGGLGKGIAMLRSMATPNATKVKVPLSSNQALYNLLDYNIAENPIVEKSTAHPVIQEVIQGAIQSSEITPEMSETELLNCESSASESPELEFRKMTENAEIAAIVRRLRTAGKGKNAIIEIVWDAKPGGSKAYREASRLYDTID